MKPHIVYMLVDNLGFGNVGYLRAQAGAAAAAAGGAEDDLPRVDGAKVVLKLQHRAIEPLMRKDMVACLRLCTFAKWLNPDFHAMYTVMDAWQHEMYHEFNFQTEADMAEWILTKDSDWGEGYSAAEFSLSPLGHAVWRGDLSTRHVTTLSWDSFRSVLDSFDI